MIERKICKIQINNEIFRVRTKKHLVCIGSEVWMSELKYLDDHDDGHDIHECCVKLEVLLSRTDVIASTQHSLKHQSQSHGVEDAKLMRNSLQQPYCIGITPGVSFKPSE